MPAIISQAPSRQLIVFSTLHSALLMVILYKNMHMDYRGLPMPKGDIQALVFLLVTSSAVLIATSLVSDRGNITALLSSFNYTSVCAYMLFCVYATYKCRHTRTHKSTVRTRSVFATPKIPAFVGPPGTGNEVTTQADTETPRTPPTTITQRPTIPNLDLITNKVAP